MTVDYVSVIASESARFVELLEAGPLDARVPGTPAWSLGELGAHLVDVQQWATAIVTTGAAPVTEPPPPPAAESAAALARSSRELVAALEAADPDRPCWNFSSAPQTTAFWFRRQALEVSLHRWDAASAIFVRPEPLDPEVAADVIDEFVHIMLRRVIDRERLDVSAITEDVHVHCTDTDALGVAGEWTFEMVGGELRVSDEHRKAAVAIRGEASSVALFLYNRVPAEAVEIFGDTAALERWSPVFRF